jgi:DNA repair exonuclease SbcCD ATPase subunit
MIGGAVALTLGIVGIFAWFEDFIIILKGSLPILLILGGILGLYIGYDDYQEKMKEEKRKQQEELEKLRAQTEQYKEELEKIKGSGNANP